MITEYPLFQERPTMHAKQVSVLDEPTFPDTFQAVTNLNIEEVGDKNTMMLEQDSNVDIEL